MSAATTLALIELVLVTSLFLLLWQGARFRRLSAVFLPQRANVAAARRRNALTAAARRRGGSAHG